MRIRAFEYLIEINNCKSMLIASNKLHITPQALGNSIKKLEDYYCCQLLVRTPTGSHLSEKGIELVDTCSPFLAELNSFAEKNYTAKKPVSNESYHIFATSGALEHILASLTTSVQADYPNTSFDYSIYSLNTALEKLTTNEIDIFFCYQYRLNNNPLPVEIVFESLKKYKHYCFMHNKFKHSSHKSISLKDIPKYPQVFYKSSFLLQKDIFKTLNSKTYIAENLTVYKELVSKGLGVTIAAPTLFSPSESKNIRMLELVEPVSMDFGYLSLKGNNSERYTHLLDLFAKYL